jgi:hypothetical protein
LHPTYVDPAIFAAALVEVKVIVVVGLVEKRRVFGRGKNDPIFVVRQDLSVDHSKRCGGVAVRLPHQ